MANGRQNGLWSGLYAMALGICLTACGQVDRLSELPQGETGRVVRIIDGDALVLDTGLTVRLVGVEPLLRKDAHARDSSMPENLLACLRI